MYNKQIQADLRAVFLLEKLKFSKARSVSQITCFVCKKEMQQIEHSQRRYIKVKKLKVCYFCLLRILSQPFFFKYLEKVQENKTLQPEELIHLRALLPIFLIKNHSLLNKIMKLRYQENESITMVHLNRIFNERKDFN